MKEGQFSKKEAKGTLLFFTNTIPIEESGSFVIFRRHLLPLVEEGWRLKIFSYFPAPVEPLFWEHHVLPKRLAWWPPAYSRSLISQKLRIKLLVHHLKRTGALEGPSPRVLLANLWDFQALIAANLAQSGFAKLGVFVHDDEIAWGRDLVPHRYLHWCRNYITASAQRIWSVSHRLIQQFPSHIQASAKVLRPVPGSFKMPPAQWRPEFSRGVHLGYAGKIYPGLSPLLKTLSEHLASAGGTLTIITDPTLASSPPVQSPTLRWMPYFAKPEDATAWLLKNCSALLVSHPLADDLPKTFWRMLRTSFPSKLTEYARLGLPLVVMGDRNSELGDWSGKHPEIPFFHEARSPGIAGYFLSLCHESSWTAASEASLQLAADEFDPALIQSQFRSDLMSLT